MNFLSGNLEAFPGPVNSWSIAELSGRKIKNEYRRVEFFRVRVQSSGEVLVQAL